MSKQVKFNDELVKNFEHLQKKYSLSYINFSEFAQMAVREALDKKNVQMQEGVSK